MIEHGVMRSSGHAVEIDRSWYPDDPTVVVVRYLEGPKQGKRHTVSAASVRTVK